MLQTTLLLAMALLTSTDATAPYIGRQGADVVIATGLPSGTLKVNGIDIMAEVGASRRFGGFFFAFC